MVESPKVFSCPHCERLFDSNGVRLSPQLCVPVSQECGRDDCAGVLAAKVAAAQARVVSKVAKRRERRERQHCRTMHHGLKANNEGDCHRGMPPEREDSEVDGHPLTHVSQQREFSTSDTAQSQNEAMLEELLRTFDLHDATRTARSRWVTNAEWSERFGITRPNSRASQLNGSDTLQTHPLIKMHRLFVDSRVQPGTLQVWERSLCFVERSLHIARERKKEDNHQMAMETQ